MQTPVRVGVIGAGPGGYAAAYRAADLGCAVTLVDRSPDPGGVCTYRGCIPSKALLHIGKLLTEAKEARQFGVAFGSPSLDLDRMRSWKHEIVTQLTRGNGQLAAARKIKYVAGTASILGPQRLGIRSEGGEQTLDVDYIILATGSRPSTLPGCDLSGNRVWDSTSALDLPFVPERLLVVGGGYIGLELGTVYAALGSRVTVVEATDQLLAGVDSDLTAVLRRRLDNRFHQIVLRSSVDRLTETATDMRALLRIDGRQVEEPFDAVLVAVGRRPNSGIAGLERTRVEVDRKGTIRTDEQRRTAEPSIFAVGDVAGQPMLAHKAMHEGYVAAEVIAGERVRFAPRAIPAVVFTDPEIAWCGLTETQAAAASRTIEVAKFPWSASGRASTLAAPDGLTKLILEPSTGRVLGAGIVGAGAGELIAEAVLAIEMGASAKEIALSIHPHPTLSETLMEASEIPSGLSTHVFRPPRCVAV